MEHKKPRIRNTSQILKFHCSNSDVTCFLYVVKLRLHPKSLRFLISALRVCSGFKFSCQLRIPFCFMRSSVEMSSLTMTLFLGPGLFSGVLSGGGCSGGSSLAGEGVVGCTISAPLACTFSKDSCEMSLFRGLVFRLLAPPLLPVVSS